MRLTLRTLLAYLDDRLPPNNAKEIGQKIAKSPFATELVERIRDVKRRRRLASPAKPQPMIDANLVAEYLDDQLTPELVARVEREILASDALLAEVASAHEILGMLRDPVAIEPRLRDRLYLMDPTGQLEVVRAAGGEVSPSTQNAAGNAPQWKPLKSHSTSNRRWPIIVGALLGLIWIAVVATDSRLFSTSSRDGKAVDSGDVKVAAHDLEAPARAADGSAPEDAFRKRDTDVGEKVNSDLAERPGDDAPAVVAEADKPKASDVSEPAAGPENPTTEPVVADVDAAKADGKDSDKTMSGEPSKEPAVAAAEPPAADAPKDPPVPAVPEIAVDDRPASYYVQAESAATLVFDEKADRWMTLASIAGGDGVTMAANQVDCRRLTGRNWIAIPESFHSMVRTDVGGWSATIPGPSHLRLRGGPDSGFDVLSGRLRIAVDPAAVWNDETKSAFQLGTGSVTARVVLQAKESRIAIEVIPLAATVPVVMDDEKVKIARALPIDAELQVQLTVIEGGTSVTLPAQGEQQPVEQLLNRGQRMLWTVLTDGTVSSVTIDNGEPLASAPRWLFETDVQEVPELAAIKSKLIEAMATNPDPDECIHPLFSDRNLQIGVLAVRIASITRDVERLMSVVYAEHDEVVHRAAIDGLSAILRSSGTGRGLIQRSVETRVPMAQVEPTMKLIAGLTPAQAADPNVVIDLMRMLEDNSLAIRTLAIYRMEQHTKDRMNYFPDNEPSRRREAIRRWQRFLDRNGGKLIP